MPTRPDWPKHTLNIARASNSKRPQSKLRRTPRHRNAQECEANFGKFKSGSDVTAADGGLPDAGWWRVGPHRVWLVEGGQR